MCMHEGRNCFCDQDDSLLAPPELLAHLARYDTVRRMLRKRCGFEPSYAAVTAVLDGLDERAEATR
jgi:hypothetical protein